MNYPKDYADFSDGLNCTEEEINEWIDECIEYLEENNEKDFTNILTGNTLVQVNKYIKKGKYSYQVIVTKNYKEGFTNLKCVNK